MHSTLAIGYLPQGGDLTGMPRVKLQGADTAHCTLARPNQRSQLRSTDTQADARPK